MPKLYSKVGLNGKLKGKRNLSVCLLLTNAKAIENILVKVEIG